MKESVVREGGRHPPPPHITHPSHIACLAAGGDHLVGWANSSIRFLHQLPALPAQHSRARGVVLEEPFSAAWDLESSPQAGPDEPISVEDVPIER